jgi:hypothetical protein
VTVLQARVPWAGSVTDDDASVPRRRASGTNRFRRRRAAIPLPWNPTRSPYHRSCWTAGVGVGGRVPTADVASALDAGRSVSDIAAAWGCTPRTVRNVANAARLSLPQARRRVQRQAPMSDPSWLRRELVDRRRTVSAVAQDVGLPTDAVRAAAIAAGVVIPPLRRATRYPQLHDGCWVEARFANGGSLYSIADGLGCSVAAVRAAAIRFDITDRRPPGARTFWQLHDGSWLRQRYVDVGLSSGRIAADIGCSTGSVLRALEAAGVPRRREVADTTPLRDERWLRARYHDDGMSSIAIAAELGCAPQTVLNALARMQVPIRRRHGADTAPLWNTDWLRTRYVDDGLTAAAIAAEVGCAPQTVANALARSGIPTRIPTRSRPTRFRLRTDWRLFGSVSAVARLNEVGPQLAERWLAEVGIFPPRARRLRSDDLAEALAASESIRGVARRLGVSSHRVRIEVLRRGLESSNARTRTPRPSA